MRTKKDELLEIIFAPLGIIIVIVSFIMLGGLATSCSSSIATTQYQAEFEKAQPLSTFPVFTGDKKVIQIANLNVNKELWEMFPELRDKRVGMGVSNRIIENFEVTQRFTYAEEKEAIVSQMLDVWEKDLNDMGDGKTKLNVGSLVLPKYIVYAEIYEFSTSYGETYNKGKVEKTNTTIIGIQIKMVNVDNSQYIVASGQGTSTQVGEGFFKNPTMGFDQSTVGVSTQRALEVATVNLMKRMDQYVW